MQARWLAIIPLAFTLGVAGCAAGPEPDVGIGPERFGLYDRNSNGCVDRSEFGVQWNNEFGVWDDDRSGFVDATEWGAEIGVENNAFGAFGDWDLDDDNLLSTDEFGVGGFGALDANRDSCIGVNEWEAGVGLWS